MKLLLNVMASIAIMAGFLPIITSSYNNFALKNETSVNDDSLMSFQNKLAKEIAVIINNEDSTSTVEKDKLDLFKKYDFVKYINDKDFSNTLNSLVLKEFNDFSFLPLTIPLNNQISNFTYFSGFGNVWVDWHWYWFAHYQVHLDKQALTSLKEFFEESAGNVYQFADSLVGSFGYALAMTIAVGCYALSGAFWLGLIYANELIFEMLGPTLLWIRKA